MDNINFYTNELNEIILLRKNKEFNISLKKIKVLISLYPKEAALYYHAAWIYDNSGREKEAIDFYLKAIELGLKGNDLRDAFLGLASTYRAIGFHIKAKEIFMEGIKKFPNYRHFKVFLAITEYNLKNSKESIILLLSELLDTTNDNEILKYEIPLRFYLTRLDEIFS